MQKISIEKFLYRASLKHDNFYDYSKVFYENTKIKINIICPLHGEFKQIPEKHMAGQGCPKCGINLAAIKRMKLQEEFIKDSNIIHNFKYNYSKTIYNGLFKNVIIICPIHGEYLQLPCNHLNQKKGCGQCANNVKYTLEEFIEKVKNIHGHKYDYSKSIYINICTKIKIICPIHGEFEQLPAKHLLGTGCRRCSNSNSSKLENKWLDELNINCRQYNIVLQNKHFKLDGYDSKTNTVYEFNGDYWHGNPKKYNWNDINKINKKTFLELYLDTLNKEQLLINAGYNIISIWESDYKKCLK